MGVGRDMGVHMRVGFCLASISAAGEAGCWLPSWPLRLVVQDSPNPLWRVGQRISISTWLRVRERTHINKIAHEPLF